MANDLVSRNCFYELNLIVGLEICHLVLHLPYDFEVVDSEHQLDIDVDLVRYLPQSILHQ